MKFTRSSIVMATGCIVLAAIVGMLLALAFLGGGHPPASGYVNWIILLVAGPLSVIASAVGLTTPPQADGKHGRFYFVMTGVCTAFALFAVLLFVLKAVLGAAI